MRPGRTLGTAFAAVVLAALVACGPAYRGEPLYGPLATSDPQVVQGERLFARHCHECHPGGDAGVGFAINDRPLPSFAIRFQVRHGIGAMPAFPEDRLAEDELNAIIAYLHALRAHEPEAAAPR